MLNTFINLPLKQKLIILSVPIFIIIVTAISLFMMNRDVISEEEVKIQNSDQYLSNISIENRHTIQEVLYDFLTEKFNLDIKPSDIYIREDSYSEEIVDEFTISKFIIDIDSLKISYRISFASPYDKYTSENPIIDCPELSEMKYPDTPCVGMYNSTQSLQETQNNPINEVLPIIIDEFDFNSRTAVHYEIHGFFDIDNNSAFSVNIIDYSGNNYYNAIQLIRERGFNPEDYNINYYSY